MDIYVPYQNVECDYVPTPATMGAAGWDLRSRETVTLFDPGDVVMVPLGIKLEIPHGYYGQLHIRSGLASRGVMLANGVGIIDSDYRGEVCALLRFFKHQCYERFSIREGDRVAQLVFRPVIEPVFTQQNLNTTERDAGGFGSTGD